mmetsp:Transcript_71474/g.134734  ORF Transcript_71474/g.134734 Transcript_71474/m.134734 type:complete len:222 (+) Transcript_71474:120-785(+)
MCRQMCRTDSFARSQNSTRLTAVRPPLNPHYNFIATTQNSDTSSSSVYSALGAASSSPGAASAGAAAASAAAASAAAASAAAAASTAAAASAAAASTAAASALIDSMSASASATSRALCCGTGFVVAFASTSFTNGIPPKSSSLAASRAASMAAVSLFSMASLIDFMAGPLIQSGGPEYGFEAHVFFATPNSNAFFSTIFFKVCEPRDPSAAVKASISLLS